MFVDFGTDSLSAPSLNFFEELCAYAREPRGAIGHLAVPCGNFQRGRLDLRPTNMGVWAHILRSVDMGHSHSRLAFLAALSGLIQHSKIVPDPSHRLTRWRVSHKLNYPCPSPEKKVLY